MIQNLKYAIIADIGSYNLTFFDDDNQRELESFCRRNLISYLPGRDRKSIHKLTDRGFIRQDLSDKVLFKPYDRIFDLDVLKKFGDLRYDNVGFITEHDIIKGVVHIVDYNCEFIKVEFYRALYRFDENLRRLLLNNLFKNEDFINWVNDQKEKEKDTEKGRYWSERYKAIRPDDPDLSDRLEHHRMNSKAFGNFYLADLLEYTTDLGLLDKDKVYIDQVKNVRNSIIYSMDTDKALQVEEDEVFDYTNLKNFVTRSRSFFDAYEYLLDKVIAS